MSSNNSCSLLDIAEKLLVTLHNNQSIDWIFWY